MRYILVQVTQILREYSHDYLTEHIIKSLDSFFRTAEHNFIDEIYYQQEFRSLHLNINDVSDPNVMLVFAYHGQTRTGAHKVSYVGRIKG